jgi:RimJ/RimL family protein N-acetyltransferase
MRLAPVDAERYLPLRRRILTLAPWAFSATPEDDAVLDVLHLSHLLASEHHVTFAIEARLPTQSSLEPETEAKTHPPLVASASITRAPPPKYVHRVRVWGVLVEPEYRGRALGKALVRAILEQARAWQGLEFLDLGVSAHSPEAKRLYESFGFRAWGREAQATEHDGRRYDELHMTLRVGAWKAS